MTQSTRSHLLRGVIVLVLVLMISLLTVQLSPSPGLEQVRAAPNDSLLQQSTASRLDALEAQVAALAQRVAQLEAAAGASTPAASPTSRATTATAATARPSVASNANVRSGPSTGYPVVRTLRAGETLTLLARNSDAGDIWYQVDEDAWIYGSLVQNAPSGLPYAAAPALSPTRAPVPTPTPVAAGGGSNQVAVPANSLTANQSTSGQAAAPAPAVPAATCDCGGNTYNCGDFGSQNQAQSCFNACQAQGVGDIHRLDRDNDGAVCESLP